jgi:undecaprenyl-diphosphatase
MNQFMTRRRAIPAIAGVVLFAAIAYFIMTRDTLAFDTVVREFIYGLRSGGLTVLLKTITYLGNAQTVTLICCIFLVVPRSRLTFGVPLSVSSLLAVSIQKVLKTAFHRQRPDLTLHLISQGGYSFPSGHSFTVLIFYGMMIYLCRRYIKDRRMANLITVLLSCLIAVIGFSRVYLGVHYPTDVLGGWSLGISMLMVFISGLLFFQRVKRQTK